MRLFVAIPVPGALKERLAGVCGEIMQAGLAPVKPENMHLTLKFLGEAEEGKLPEIKEKLGAINFAPFNCSLKGVGAFPDEHYVRVLWAGCESGGALEALAKETIEALRGHGDDKPFSAHLTIARVKRKLDLKDFLERHKEDYFGEFEANEFHLIQSVLTPGGPQYSVLAVFKPK